MNFRLCAMTLGACDDNDADPEVRIQAVISLVQGFGPRDGAFLAGQAHKGSADFSRVLSQELDVLARKAAQ